MHERKAVRQAMLATLTGAAPAFATAARDRVFASRLAPLQMAELPALNVFVDSEEITEASAQTAPRELTRTAVIVVEGWVAASSTPAVDDALDDLALEIETAMDGAADLNGTVADQVLTTTDMGLKLDGARPMGCVRLEYAVTYRTDLRVVAPTDDFLTADLRYSLNATQAAADQAHDSKTVR